MDLLNKLEKCVTFNDVILLSEELHKNGISVQRTKSNKIILCAINADGDMSCNKLFEDFVPLTTFNNENGLLPAKTLSNIMEFVKVNFSKNIVKPKGSFDASALYGSSIDRMAVTRDMERLIINELKAALGTVDEMDVISRGCDEV
jgi:hypothetical protein